MISLLRFYCSSGVAAERVLARREKKNTQSEVRCSRLAKAGMVEARDCQCGFAQKLSGGDGGRCCFVLLLVSLLRNYPLATK